MWTTRAVAMRVEGIPVVPQKKEKPPFSSTLSVCPCEYNPDSSVSELLSQPCEVLPQGMFLIHLSPVACPRGRRIE